MKRALLVILGFPAVAMAVATGAPEVAKVRHQSRCGANPDCVDPEYSRKPPPTPAPYDETAPKTPLSPGFTARRKDKVPPARPLETPLRPNLSADLQDRYGRYTAWLAQNWPRLQTLPENARESEVAATKANMLFDKEFDPGKP